MAGGHSKFDKGLPQDDEVFVVSKWSPQATDIMGGDVYMARQSSIFQAPGRIVIPTAGGRPPWDMAIQGYDGPISFSKALYNISNKDRGALEEEVIKYLCFVSHRFVNPDWPQWMEDAVTQCLTHHVNFRYSFTSQSLYRNQIAPYVSTNQGYTVLPNFVAVQALRCAFFGRISPHMERAFDRCNLGWLLDPRTQLDADNPWTVFAPDGTEHNFYEFNPHYYVGRTVSEKIPVRPPPTYIIRPDGQVWLRQAEAGRLTFMSNDNRRRRCLDRHDVYGDEDDKAHIVRATTPPITLSSVPSCRAKQVAAYWARRQRELPLPPPPELPPLPQQLPAPHTIRHSTGPPATSTSPPPARDKIHRPGAIVTSVAGTPSAVSAVVLAAVPADPMPVQPSAAAPPAQQPVVCTFM